MKPIVRIYSISFILLTLLLSGCEEEIFTGLEGIVYRGPINPVEIQGVPNDAPFAAEFKVFDSSQNLVATFSSNDDGEYKVVLQPGDYTIVPTADAPLMQAENQSHEARVIGSEDFTEKDLYFDTGIR